MYEALSIEERAKLRALAPTIQALAKVARSNDSTLRHALAGGLLAPNALERLRRAIGGGQ